jgi:hypothetical protein
VVLAVVLSRSGDGSGSGGELFAQSADKTGPDPFTESTAKDSSAPPATLSASPATGSASANVVRRVDGAAAGLYGGTRNVSSCDVEKQIKALGADPAKNRAFASVEGIAPSRVPAYLRSLTPVQLRLDTRVTNHGYRNGAATTYQAVLQTGTAVLVDGRGVPRVRCACGNPLTLPTALTSTPKLRGDSWPSYRSSNMITVTPAPRTIDVFVLYDVDHGGWIARHRGDTGHHDRRTHAPAKPSPSVSASTATPPSTPSSSSACASSPGADDGSTPCPQTSTAPSTAVPSTEPPSSEPVTSPPDTVPPESPESSAASPAL